ncbi:MAG: hypothetical protein ACTSPS_05055 [Promethearchaeota archaeon]
MPPSTKRLTPVQNSFVAMNKTPSAISLGFPRRPSLWRTDLN